LGFPDRPSSDGFTKSGVYESLGRKTIPLSEYFLEARSMESTFPPLIEVVLGGIRVTPGRSAIQYNIRIYQDKCERMHAG
jgi:hypothetical protein